MEENTKDEIRYALDFKRLILLAVVLLIIFFGILSLLYMKADEVTKHPCQVCAEKYGYNVTCYSKDYLNQRYRIYTPDGTILDTTV